MAPQGPTIASGATRISYDLTIASGATRVGYNRRVHLEVDGLDVSRASHVVSALPCEGVGEL